MMPSGGSLTLRNYRCFDWSNPATLEFGEGFTAIIGPNNSGKSALLRAAFELRHMIGNIQGIISSANQFRIAATLSGVTDHAETTNDRDLTGYEFEIEIPSVVPQVGIFIATRIVFRVELATNHCRAIQIFILDCEGGVTVLSEEDIRTGDNSSGIWSNVRYANRGVVVDFTSIFEFGRELAASKYYPAFRNAINEGAGNHYDLPVGTALVHAWDEWKAGNSKASKIAIANVEQQIAKLLGFRSLQINADQTGRTLDVIIDDRPHKLHEVGAGVAQLIIVLASVLVFKPPYILIDEPELSLHPALQLNFLATLASHVKKGVLFATHSIGLARSSAQRILVTKKAESGICRVEPFGTQEVNYAEWLGELNYSSRVELGCEGVVLVEGPNDVLVFQEFLRKTGKDSKYVVMQLGGSSLINGKVGLHMGELTRLVNPQKIHIFIDSERAAEGAQLDDAHTMFVSECEALGIHVRVSERRATENYFEDGAIQKVLGNQRRALGPFEVLKKAANPWHKADNWKIARETDFKKIENTDLGEFIKSL